MDQVPEVLFLEVKLLGTNGGPATISGLKVLEQNKI
jgi:hypothetical protein